MRYKQVLRCAQDDKVDNRPSPTLSWAMASARSFSYAFYYYGFPVTGRGWKRMRD